MKTLIEATNKWSVCNSADRERIVEIASIVGTAKSIDYAVELGKMTKEEAYERLIKIIGL